MKTIPPASLKTPFIVRSSRALFTALFLIAVLCGCRTPVRTEFKPETNFAALRTFALMPLPQSIPANDPGLLLRLAKPAEESVTTTLMAKGFQPVERDKADFVVNLRGQSWPKVEVTDWGYTRTTFTRYGHVPVHVGEVDVRTYDERTLTIEIFDNKSHELVWVGSITKTSTGTVSVERLQKAVAEILARFPPQAGPSK